MGHCIICMGMLPYRYGCIYKYEVFRHHTCRMGVGLAEYRAAIGRFAAVAFHLQLYQRTKTKHLKSKRVKEKNGDNNPKEESSNADNGNRCYGSLDRWATTRKRRGSKQRSATFGPQPKRDHIRKIRSTRRRSQSCAKRRNGSVGLATQDLKDACIRCRTDWVSQGWERGRTRRGKTQKQCCLFRGSHENDIETRNLGILTYMAVSECMILELAIATVVQMLLIRSGIEMNPGNFNLTPFSSHHKL